MQRIVFILVMMTFTGIAQAQATYVKRVYNSSCNYSHPLDTYDGCGYNTRAGQAAMSCAYNDALVECENDDNVSCIEIGVRFEAVMSREFVGYKYCKARVIVHGFGRK